MTTANLAWIYSPWMAVSLTALVLAFRPGVFKSPRLRSLASATAVILLAYPIGVLVAPTWTVLTVWVLPGGLAAVSVALALVETFALLRARRAAPSGLDGGQGSAAAVLARRRDSGSATMTGRGTAAGGNLVASDAAASTTGTGATDAAAGLGGTAGRRRLRPRERTSAVRGVQYGVLLGVLVVLAFAIDWPRISDQMFTIEGIREAAPRIIPDFLNTLKYTLGAFCVSLSLGLILALMKLSQAKLYRALATTYIEFFRGLPALIVVFAVAYGIPMALGVNIPSISLKAAVALGCVSAAYMAESIRAGIQAVPDGQIEASRSLGMTHSQTLQSVVIPQAFRIVLPPVTNEIILLTKDTSLVYVMGLTVHEWELSKLARETLKVPHGGLTALFAISACYLIITLPLGFLVRRMEKDFGKAKS